MKLQAAIETLVELGEVIRADDENWQEKKREASMKNNWFTTGFIDLAAHNILTEFLQKEKLDKWASAYKIPAENKDPKQVGIVMAGNIPLVGFHDFLSVFITGHRQTIKLSSKDEVLLKYLVKEMITINPGVQDMVSFEERLKGCDAYIATGSNNSSRYFEYYFSKYPHIIRKNRTSVALLTGKESAAELDQLADDIHLYFGLGCRNVTKIYVPKDYDFIPLLHASRKYSYFAGHSRFKNNYDYHLAMHILNNKYYMSNENLLLVEDPSLFSPISQLNYEFYISAEDVIDELKNNKDIQCIVGYGGLPLGKTQQPGLSDYADGEDSLKFLLEL